MRKLHGLFALALLGASSTAMSQSLPLNTGFDHSNFTNLTGADNYWIKVAASNSSPGPSFVIANTNSAWQSLPPSSGGFLSKWIGLTAAGTSPSGQTTYAVYRKCFCLTPNYKQAQLDFKMRGDDVVGVWLNSNNIVPIQGGNFYGPVINGAATPSQFQTGRNCLYVVVLDTGSVVTGFNLSGTVSAYGLMPMASAGLGASFKPCTCEGPATISEEATIKAIVSAAKAAASNSGPIPIKPDGPRTR